MKSRNASEISIKRKSRTDVSQSRPASESESITESLAHVPSKSVSAVTIRYKSKSKKKKNEPQQETDFEIDSEADLNEPKISLEPNSERHNWCKESVTEYAFNLPTVRTNLNRLIDTDIVKLNEHKFMMDLRIKVWKEFNQTLHRKVAQRKDQEIERTKNLILKSKFSRYNCPEKLIPLHSAVLALNLDAEQMNVIKPNEAERLNRYDGPVFNVNKKTNNTVRLRRMQLKSIRKKNYEYLMRQVFKDIKHGEKLRYNELKVIQENIKHIHDGIDKKKAKKSKYLKVITRMVDKLKSMLKSKTETKQSQYEKTLMEAISQKSIKADLADRATHPDSFKDQKIKSTLKNGLRESNSKNSGISKKDSRNYCSTSSISRDTRKLKKSQSKVSFGKEI